MLHAALSCAAHSPTAHRPGRRRSTRRPRDDHRTEFGFIAVVLSMKMGPGPAARASEIERHSAPPMPAADRGTPFRRDRGGAVLFRRRAPLPRTVSQVALVTAARAHAPEDSRRRQSASGLRRRSCRRRRCTAILRVHARSPAQIDLGPRSPACVNHRAAAAGRGTSARRTAGESGPGCDEASCRRWLPPPVGAAAAVVRHSAADRRWCAGRPAALAAAGFLAAADRPAPEPDDDGNHSGRAAQPSRHKTSPTRIAEATHVRPVWGTLPCQSFRGRVARRTTARTANPARLALQACKLLRAGPHAQAISLYSRWIPRWL